MQRSRAHTFSREPRRAFRQVLAGWVLAGVAAGVVPACVNPLPVLTQLLEARRLASELQLEFTKAADAANRAVMADTDEAATSAADEARRARQIVERDVDALQALLQSLGYDDDSRVLDLFKTRFDEYRRLDDEILPMTIENTNVKAQRLSFGPAQEAADAFRVSVDAALQTAAAKDVCCASAVAARARSAVLEIQVMQAPHIAEAEDAAMTRMEEEMTASAADARKALGELRTALAPRAESHLAAAAAALDRFMAIHTEIIALSRRNSDVRSLALSLGRKRIVTAECVDHLRALEAALAKHQSTATR